MPLAERVATFDTIAEISFAGLPSPTVSSPVAVNSDHSLVALALRDGGEILVFNREGTFVREVGRRGEGPGEFREITLLVFDADSDSLWVMDHENGRITVVPPDTVSPSRDFSLRGRFFGAAWAADTTLMINGNFADGGPANALLRAVHPQSVQPVALEQTVLVGDGFTDLIRPVTSAMSGGVWTGHFREPLLRRVDPSGSVIQQVTYDAPALRVVPRNAEAWAGFIDTRPAVLGMTEDSEGDLWILFGVPADPLPAVDDPARAFAEGTLEVDDISRTVLARYRKDSMENGPAEEFPRGALRGGLLPGGMAYYFEPDAVGELTLTVVRLGSRSVQSSIAMKEDR